MKPLGYLKYQNKHSRHYTEEQNLTMTTNQSKRVTTFHDSEAGRQSDFPLAHCHQNVPSVLQTCFSYSSPVGASSACVCMCGILLGDAVV